MEPLALASLALAAGLAGFTQGFAGFGSTLVALPLLAAVFDVRVAVPVGCLMALAINILMVARLHGQVRRGALGLLLGASLPGMAAGVWLLGDAPEALLKGVLGASVLLLALQSLLASRPGGIARSTAPTGRGWAVAAGLAAGCLGVAIGINGPPVVAWASRQPWSRDALKATLTSFFLLAGVAVVGVQAFQGLLTPQVLSVSALAVPPLLAGLWLGWASCGRINDRAFRRAVFTLLAVTGAAMVWQAGAMALRS